MSAIQGLVSVIWVMKNHKPKRIIKEQATIGQYSTNLSIKIGTNVIDTLKNEGFNITKGITTYKVSWKDIVV